MSARVIIRRAILPAVALILLAAPGHASAGDLVLDQHLIGNPECNLEDLGSSISSGGPIRQEFVPDQPIILAVELCLSFDANAVMPLNVRTGSAKNPGPVLTSSSIIAPMTNSPAFLWFDLDAAVFLEPGVKYVLEVPESFDFAWLGACGAVALPSCDGPDPDPYPEGVTNFDGIEGFESIGKLAFRTYSGPFPEPLVWGDADCTTAVNAIDALKTLQAVAAIPYAQDQPCPSIGVPLGIAIAGDNGHPWGDVDCDGDLDAVDALQILRSVAALPTSQQPNCPMIATEVIVGP